MTQMLLTALAFVATAAAARAPTTTTPKTLAPSSDTAPVAVTEGFCKQVLKDIAGKKAPYFVEDKWTGECRRDLTDQCGDRMCGWAVKYKKALAAECPGCPADEAACKSDFTTKMLAPDESSVPCDGTVKILVEQLVKDNSGSFRFAQARGGGGDVTEGFCMQVLKDIAGKKAPYFVEGKWTGECREALTEQCGEIVCGWAVKYKTALATECPGCPADEAACKSDFTTKMLAPDESSVPCDGTVKIMVEQLGKEEKKDE